MKSKPQKRKQVIGLLGIGLDGDGEKRVTTADHFLLIGGSAKTHERMQDTAIRFHKAFERRGKLLGRAKSLEIEEFLRIVENNS